MYIIYGMRDCEYCELAVEELEKRQQSFFYYPMDNGIHRKGPTLQEIKDRHSWPTVPIILKSTNEEQKFIGGYTELIAYLEAQDES